MTIAIQVSGPCLIKLDSGNANALEDLGYSENGVRIEEEQFHSDVPGDQNGGDEGPPIDVQYFGEIHRLRMELSSWDAAVAAKILAKLKGGTAGVLGSAGSLMGAGGFYWRLILLTANLPRNYLRAFPRGQPVELNKGTKYSRLVLNVECHAAGVGGTVYNTTTS